MRNSAANPRPSSEPAEPLRSRLGGQVETVIARAGKPVVRLVLVDESPPIPETPDDLIDALECG